MLVRVCVCVCALSVCVLEGVRGAFPSDDVQDVIDATEECTHGYTLANKMCLKEIQRKPLAQCPPKASHENGMCVSERVLPFEYTCGDSQTLIGDRCEYEEMSSAVAACPANFTFTSTGCLRSQEVNSQAQCPPFFRINETRDTCVRETKERTTLICPKGTQQTGLDTCAKTLEVESMRSCPRGYTLKDDSQCLKVETNKADAKCPAGYRMESGKCQIATRVPANAVCPGDHEYNGRECTKTHTMEAKITCESGYQLHEGKCLRLLEKEPIIECPAKYDALNGECVKTSTLKPRTECPEGTITMNTVAGKVCESLKAINVTLSCPLEFLLEDDKCVRRSSAMPVTECPMGFRPSNGKCKQDTTVKPTEVCMNGRVLKDGHCVSVEAVPPKISCDAGTATPQGTCVLVFSAEKQYSCPRGYKLEVTNCVRKAHTAAAAVCPAGSRMRGNSCVSIEVNPLQNQCDEGFVSDDAGNCVKYESKAPKYNCPRSHKLFNHYCVRRALGDNEILRRFM